jgi:hypothetical protein
MKVKQDIIIDEQKIKEILVAIKEPKKPFEVSIKKEGRIRKLGEYSYNRARMTLYLLNFNSNNEIIRTAIHEYAHHIMGSWGGHKTEFWNCYFQLLEIAEKKGFYSCDIDKSDKLKKITSIIKTNDLLKNRKIFKERLDFIFYIINKLCDEIGIDFQYYSVKYLGMDWYKKKNPYSSYKYFCRTYVLYSTNHRIYIKNMDDYLQIFFNQYNISGNKET